MGKVYLVGAGPGAPDLLTLRAAELLKRADVVFYDALVHPETVGLAAQAKKIAVGKRAGRLSTDQRFINRALVEVGLRHACVVRLKGGDPMLFARAQEEIDALCAAGVEVEVVPGVTAALAAAASLRVSLTRRGMSRTVSFATPRAAVGETAGKWVEAVVDADTAILYMAIGEAAVVQKELLARHVNPATPIVVVENASLPNERQIGGTLGTLPTIAEANLKGPCILCIGEVFRAPLQVRDSHSGPAEGPRDLRATAP